MNLYPYKIEPSKLIKSVDFGTDHYRIKEFNKLGYNGDSVKVAVIDTGIEWDHRFLDSFNGELIVESTVGDSGYDDDGHGTWCCSQFVGTVGWSPNLDTLVSIKCMRGGSGQLDWFYDAVKLAVDYGVDIISASLGWHNNGRVDQKLEEVMHMCRDNNILFFGAAGNDGSYEDVDLPAAHEWAFSVGSHDSSLGRSSFSDLGHNLDLYQHGEQAYGAYLGGKFRELSGTSMATPRAAAVMAMFLKSLGNIDRSSLDELVKCDKH